MIRSELEIPILKTLARLGFLIGLLNKSKGGLDDSEVPGLVTVLEEVRSDILSVRTALGQEVPQ
jgi:hypothetical protein